jgi:membrane protein CcdC involved in cytochrome C biogenesis
MLQVKIVNGLSLGIFSIILPSGPAIIGSIIGLIAVMTWRVREARGAVSIKKIVIPPLGMATGFSMFIVPAFRVPLSWAAVAFLIGAVALAYPLLLTSRLVRQGDTIMMQRSNAFFTVILALAAIRLLARGYFDKLLTVQQTGALFFILAFGMILRWRAQMLIEYRRLTSA